MRYREIGKVGVFVQDSTPSKADSATLGTARPSHLGALRYSSVHFLIVLTLLFVSAPFFEEMRGGDAIEAVLLTLVLLSAVLAVGGSHRSLIFAVVLVVPALIAKWMDHLRPDLIEAEVTIGAILVFALFVVWQLVRFILLAPRVNSEVLCAGIATYLMLAFLWAFAYILVAQITPDAFVFTVGPASERVFKGFNALYFSLVTLNTGSYGGIIPVSKVARMLAAMQETVGVFYVGVMIARLVGGYSSAKPTDGAGRSGSA